MLRESISGLEDLRRLPSPRSWDVLSSLTSTEGQQERRPVTPEAAGSSPVDPAHYPSQSKGLPSLGPHRLANRPEVAGLLICKTGNSGKTDLDFCDTALLENRRNRWPF